MSSGLPAVTDTKGISTGWYLAIATNSVGKVRGRDDLLGPRRPKGVVIPGVPPAGKVNHRKRMVVFDSWRATWNINPPHPFTAKKGDLTDPMVL